MKLFQTLIAVTG
jgi:chromosome segregation ATPase